MLHKQEADELGAHLKKIVDTERKADQIGRRLTVKRGVYLWGLRACWWVPFIKFALMQIIDGVLPTPITIHMLFYIGSRKKPFFRKGLFIALGEPPCACLRVQGGPSLCFQLPDV